MNKDYSAIPIWVFKLGGSLQHDARLPDWLELLAANGAGNIVIVPGGGGYADGVRNAQRQARFDDRSAHRMALLAMAQYGYALCAMQPRLTPALSVAHVRAALAERAVPVWLPLDLLETHAGVEESWRMSSDSLAAWLAGALGAARLVLVKAARMPAHTDIETLAASGIVDELFARYARAASCETQVVDADSHEAMRAALTRAASMS